MIWREPGDRRMSVRVGILLVVLLGCGACMSEPLPVTVATVDALPESWQPSAALRSTLDDGAWTEAETTTARNAARIGVREMSDYLMRNLEAVAELGINAVECCLNATYAAENDPMLASAAATAAKDHLRTLTKPWMSRATETMGRPEFTEVVTLAIYCHQLFGSRDRTTRHMMDLANAATVRCGSLENALGMDWRRILQQDPVPNEEAYALLLWLVTLIDAKSVPGLLVPTGLDEFAPKVWAMLRDYPLVGARHYADRANDDTFYDTAYLATHIGYVPTGYGRHALTVADSPGLYRFLRENFYAVLEMGELDLVAEFVDLLRQYGATEETDIQVRHGTRHLLRLYEEAGGWMKHRESYETAASNPYDLIHKPWTAVAGVRRRVPEPVERGTYAESFRALCLGR